MASSDAEVPTVKGKDMIKKQNRAILRNMDSIYNSIVHNAEDGVVLELLDALSVCCEVYFLWEIRALEESDVNVSSHVKEHENFMVRLDEFTSDFPSKNPLKKQREFLALKEWFVAHISQSKTD